MKSICIAFIRAYQILFRPFLGQTCRFYPSCSDYAVEAFEKYGFWRAVARTFCRICRCHPWHPGGFDPLN